MKALIDGFCEFISGAWLFRLLYGVGEAISPSAIPRVHLRYRHGAWTFVYGSVPTWVKQGIESALAESGVTHAEIKRLPDGRVTFSRSLPEPIRQRIRNLVASI